MKALLPLCVLFALLCCSAAAESSLPACVEGRNSCLVLQMAADGIFSDFDPSDKLSLRVFSAALPVLASVDQHDIEHFCEENDVDESILLRQYYDATADCLYASILCSDDADAEKSAIHRVIMLFLNPDAAENAHRQMEIIRSEIDDGLIARMAEATGTGHEFIRDLIFGEYLSEPDISPDPHY